MEDTDFFGVDIVDAYDLKTEELYKIIKENTKYLDKIKKEDIKDIKVTYYKEIVVLLKDGTVFLLIQQKEIELSIQEDSLFHQQ